PVSAIAFRGLINERSEFLITTLPIANPYQQTAAAVFFPHVAAGGGWTTQLVLVNPADDTITGNVTYFDQNGKAGTSVKYAIPARSSRRFLVPATDLATGVGSARITPDASNVSPVGHAVFSYKREGFTVSEAGVPSLE